MNWLQIAYYACGAVLVAVIGWCIYAGICIAIEDRRMKRASATPDEHERNAI